MKVVQTRLSLQEYQLLADYAAKGEKSLAEALREAVVRLALDGERVDPRDVAFTLPPAVRRGGRTTNLSERVDEVVYGRKRR
jgi:hypothetical protein